MRKNSGQSLVEVIVAVGMMALLLVALLALITLSIKNSRVAQNHADAVALSQGGVELMRAYRDYSFTALQSAVRLTAYPLPSDWVVENGLSGDCDTQSYTVSENFARCALVDLTEGETDSIDVVITTYWQEGASQKSVNQTARLSQWER